MLLQDLVILFIFIHIVLSPTDPFADASTGPDSHSGGSEDYIHIRIQQRNGRKTLTTVQGIAVDYDKKKLVKAFKKVLLWGGICFGVLEYHGNCKPI